MKKMFMVFFAGIVFVSCSNDGTTSTEVKNDSTVSTSNESASPNYPYTIDHPDNWETGSRENTAVALNALKAFENGDVEKSMEYFIYRVATFFCFQYRCKILGIATTGFYRII